jgi:hypothetical protein
MEDKVLAGVWIAAGIVVGFMVWSYLAPMLGTVSPVPTA